MLIEAGTVSGNLFTLECRDFVFGEVRGNLKKYDDFNNYSKSNVEFGLDYLGVRPSLNLELHLDPVE